MNAKKGATKGAAKCYTYTSLNDVKLGASVNVYGVVRFFKPPSKSRGTDFTMMVSIVDDSFMDETDKLKCIFFNKDQQQFPAIQQVGDIVRFHRLNIRDYRGEPQGQNGPGFSWLVFDGNQNASLEPRKASSETYHFTEKDKEKVVAMRQWRNEQLDLSQEESRRIYNLSNVNCAAYFDLTCQVVGLFPVKPKLMILLVWDGTKVNIPVMKENLQDYKFEENVDIDLYVRAKNFLYQVKVYEEHVETAKTIKPGNFIVLRNLHAAKCHFENVEEDKSKLPLTDFQLHEGTSFHRGITILSGNEKCAKNLHKMLAEIPLPENYKQDLEAMKQKIKAKSKDDAIIDQCSSKDQQNKNNLCNIRAKENSPRLVGAAKFCSDKKPNTEENLVFRSRSNPCNPVNVAPDSLSSDRRCMQTSVTTTSHNHIKFSSINEVQNGKHCNKPYKYRLRAKVTDLQPHTNKVEEFLQLFCSSCNFHCAMKAFEDKPPIEVHNGVKKYKCPRCLPSTGEILEYIYMLQMILEDDTGQIIVQLWRNEALKFFDEISPKTVVKENHMFQQIYNSLCKLQGLDSKSTEDSCNKNPPWMECCIMSHGTPMGMCYQVFDTVLFMSDE